MSAIAVIDQYMTTDYSGMYEDDRERPTPVTATAYVYVILDSNLEPFYVGHTLNPNDRIARHIEATHRPRPRPTKVTQRIKAIWIRGDLPTFTLVWRSEHASRYDARRTALEVEQLVFDQLKCAGHKLLQTRPKNWPSHRLRHHR